MTSLMIGAMISAPFGQYRRTNVGIDQVGMLFDLRLSEFKILFYLLLVVRLNLSGVCQKKLPWQTQLYICQEVSGENCFTKPIRKFLNICVICIQLSKKADFLFSIIFFNCFFFIFNQNFVFVFTCIFLFSFFLILYTVRFLQQKGSCSFKPTYLSNFSLLLTLLLAL